MILVVGLTFTVEVSFCDSEALPDLSAEGLGGSLLCSALWASLLRFVLRFIADSSVFVH